jgi:hypothetical protein
VSELIVRQDQRPMEEEIPSMLPLLYQGRWKANRFFVKDLSIYAKYLPFQTPGTISPKHTFVYMFLFGQFNDFFREKFSFNT